MDSLLVSHPLELPCGVLIKNRFLKSAMSEALGDKKHQPTEHLVQLYRTWADGGAGILVSGNVMIDPKALGEPGNVVLEDGNTLKRFSAWAKAGTQNNTHFWMQINHPGKQTPKTIAKKPVAPSEVLLERRFSLFFSKPIALTMDEINTLVSKFVKTAALAKQAGFTGVQIHAAHGYLISQFLSPKANIRNDKYGGSLENRMRFLVEIYQGMRKQLGKTYPISMKININDFIKGGFEPQDAVKVIKHMANIGMDLIEISGGNYENPTMTEGRGLNDIEGYFLDEIESIQNEVNAPIVVTGGFRSIKTMENTLREGRASMIGMARPIVLDPYLPKKMMNNEIREITTKRLTTGFKRIDHLLGPLMGLSYYQYQIKRISKNKRTHNSKCGWYALIRVFGRHFRSSFRRRAH